MMASAVGSETKTETCTGRRHLIHQVIEGLRTFILLCLNWNEKNPRFFSDIHRKANARTRIRTISAVQCYSITGQDENYSREVTCHVCRLGLCATKRCKWEVDYVTRRWYLWLTLNGNMTLFFFLSFLGVQTRRKCDELCWEAQAEMVWRLNIAAYWQCLSDINYIWLLLPASGPECFQTFTRSDSFQPRLTPVIRDNKDFYPDILLP